KVFLVHCNHIGMTFHGALLRRSQPKRIVPALLPRIKLENCLVTAPVGKPSPFLSAFTLIFTIQRTILSMTLRLYAPRVVNPARNPPAVRENSRGLTSAGMFVSAGNNAGLSAVGAACL